MEGLLSKLVTSFTGDKQSGKDYWVDDSKCRACYECETPFTVFVRRHHCRICGRVFCGTCTNHELPPPRDSPDQTWLRVCTYCYRLRQRAPHSTGLDALLPPVHLGPAAAGSRAQGAGSLQSGAAGGAPLHQGSPNTKAAGQRLLRHTHSHHHRGHADAALTWEVPPCLEKQFGPSLDVVLATALPSTDTTGCTAGSSSSPDSCTTAGIRPSTGAAATAAAAASSSAQPAAGPMLPLSSRQSHPLVTLYLQEFAAAGDAHLQQLVVQLLRAEEVAQVEAWAPVIVRLAQQAADTILPAAAAAHGEQDPRHYVKVKRLPDVGSPSGSCVVAGVVAKKNVANRKMRTSIDDARVLLLAGALEYQRVNNKLSSFDTLLEQEREHLRLAVARVAAVKPDVLLVESSVARAAQEELLARGISLVQHVKRELLDRLARCTGAEVLQSVEELSGQAVGSCRQFKVEQLPTPSAPAAAAAAGGAGSSSVATFGGAFTAAAGGAAHPGGPRQVVAPPTPKTLMLFQGCPQPLGCTVLLQGAAADQLVRLKRIVKFMVLAAYHLSLESSFLAEELALATAALATEGMNTEDVEMFRALAKEVINTSLQAASPGLPDSLQLSLSPHVVDPVLMQQRVLRARWQQSRASKQQQQQGQMAGAATGLQLGPAPSQEAPGTEGGDGSAAVGTPPAAEPATPPLAAGGSSGALLGAGGGGDKLHKDVLDHPLTSDLSDTSDATSIAAAGLQQQLRELSFGVNRSPQLDASSHLANSSSSSKSLEEEGYKDPLRRQSTALDSQPSQSSHFPEGVEQLQPSGELGRVQEQEQAEQEAERTWHLEGLKLYDRQRIYLSMACRNPRRQLMCEPPAIKRIDFYCHSDLSLAGFIMAAAPHPAKKCQAADCGDGVTAHVRTFLHGNSRITLSIATLPAAEALPGEDRAQVWTWLRPKGGSADTARHVRRLPLSADTSCLSFGMFLQLCFSASGLELFGRSLHSHFVRYFGCGRTVMCLHQDAITPSAVTLPAVPLRYSLNAQLMWLKQEAAELCQESNEAFDILENALLHHPGLARQQAAAGAAQDLAASGAAPAATDAAAAVASSRDDAAGSFTGTPTAATPAAAGPNSSASSSPMPVSYLPLPATPVQEAALPSLNAVLSAVRRDRSNFVEKVAVCVQAATPATPRPDSTSTSEPAAQQPEASYSSYLLWDDLLIAGMAELNRLRRSLAITGLTWAATIQEPSLFAQALTAAAAPADNPLAAVAAGAAVNASSMFHMTPAAAAARLSPVACAEAAAAGDTAKGDREGCQSVPLLANPMGPIAVDAVAHLVADCVAADSNAPGGLLEGSHTVLQAIARASEGGGSSVTGSGNHHAAVLEAGVQPGSGRSPAGSPAASSSPQKLKSYISRKLMDSPAVVAAAPAAGEGSQASNSSSSSSPAPRRSTSRAGSWGGGSRASATSTPCASDDEGDEGEVNHDRFVSWLTSHEVGALLDEDLSDFYPEQILDWEDGSGAAALGPAPGDQGVGAAPGGTVSRAGSGRPPAVRPLTPPGTPEPSADGAPRLPPGPQSDASASSPGEGAGKLTFDQLKAQLQQQQAGAQQLRRGSCDGMSLSQGAERGAAAAEGAATRPGGLSSSLPSFHRRAASEGVVGQAAAVLLQEQEGDQAAGPTSELPATRSTGLPPAAAAAVPGTAASLPPPGAAGSLPRIRTAAAPASAALPPRRAGAPSSLGSAGTPGGGAVARLQLPGRALLPAGVNDTVVPIFDGEPTSVVSYFLCTRSYQMQLNAAIKQIFQEGRRAAAVAGTGSSTSSALPGQPGGHARAGSLDTTGSLGSSGAAAGTAGLSPATSAPAPGTGASNSSSAAAATTNSSLTSSGRRVADGGPGSTQQPQQSSGGSGGAAGGGRATRGRAGMSEDDLMDLEWLSLLLSPEPCHVKDTFEDDSPGTPWLRARFSVTAYYGPQFAELRRRCISGGEAAYVNSLSRCRKWASRGGKSNAYFAKTRDDRFIIKSLSKPEKASFLEFAPAYFEHMAASVQAGRPTCLAKVAGVYSIAFRAAGGPNSSSSASSSSLPYKDGMLDLVVMENIFYDRQISRIYDLKGSERSRFNADAAANPQDAGEVHLDDNLRRSNLQAPILVEQSLLRSMERALWADTSFLSGLGVMDYSLLVGVDKEANSLVVAIIDFIRTYTWDKQLETWVKSSGILGGNGKEPTIISPRQYMKRFRTAIASYFTVVPDTEDVEPPLDPDAV